MKCIAFVGASSQIARDLIRSMAAQGQAQLLLYVRDQPAAQAWLQASGLQHSACSVHDYAEYGRLPHEAVLNFVGVGDPRRAAEMGSFIFELTQRFDDLVLEHMVRHPERRYVFLSSGAVYGDSFSQPVTTETPARIAINRITPQDYYATAKLHAEVRHRARPELAITDVRVFNYFSRTQDLNARFFITDILRAIRDHQVLRTSDDYMVRDFLHPSDFHRLIECVLRAPHCNGALDCYSRAPVDKPLLLQAMHKRFGLRYETAPGAGSVGVNATGAKAHYYSLNHKAGELGYTPAYSSLECITTEATAILERSGTDSNKA